MTKKSVASLSASDLSGKSVLVRADFNVPLDDAGNTPLMVAAQNGDIRTVHLAIIMRLLLQIDQRRLVP